MQTGVGWLSDNYKKALLPRKSLQISVQLHLCSNAKLIMLKMRLQRYIFLTNISYSDLTIITNKHYCNIKQSKSAYVISCPH